MKILIVDDDEIGLDVLRHTLTRAGHDVIAAGSGAEALDLLDHGACNLVISDWNMPGMDGLELCRQIRAGDYPGYVYFILLTSRDRPDDIVEGLSTGADDFIAKPFNPAELTVRIRAGERLLSLETRDVAIFAMAKLADSRDPETGAHLERMRSYSRILVVHLSGQERFREHANAEYVRLIYLTSPLHDIGKVGIPDCVLLKAGRLNDREFEIMKTHTTIGAETLAAAASRYPGVKYLRMAQKIALSHHEHFDGNGYPAGLKGRDIPLCSRIVALADVYDALTSKRVYKDAFSHDVAREIILEGTGSHFDPDIIDAFMATEASFVAVTDTMAQGELVTA